VGAVVAVALVATFEILRPASEDRALLEVTRVTGQSMARVAAALGAAFAESLLRPGDTELEAAERFHLTEVRTKTDVADVLRVLENGNIYHAMDVDRVPPGTPPDRGLRFEGHPERAYHLEVLLNPHSDQVIITSRQPTEVDVEPFDMSRRPGRDLFRSLDTPEQALLIADALIASPVIGNFESEMLRKRFEKYPEAIAKIDARLAALESERAGRSERLEALAATVAKAVPANGEKIFLSGKGACLVCHRVGETGGQIGPDLRTIGRIRSARDLYESVLFPSESIARDFDTYEVGVKSSAQVRIGLIHEQTARGLELVSLSGQREEIPHLEVTTLRRIPMSLMPMGLEHTLPAEELRDLVAWLLSRK
jgi:putative heme-binding domain-containing protein